MVISRSIFGSKIFLEITYANLCENCPNFFIFGPKMACKGWNAVYLSIFWSRLVRRNIVDFLVKPPFSTLIYANWCKGWHKLTHIGSFSAKNYQCEVTTTVWPCFWSRKKNCHHQYQFLTKTSPLALNDVNLWAVWSSISLSRLVFSMFFLSKLLLSFLVSARIWIEKC